MKRETKDWGHHALKKEDTVRGIRGWFKRNRKVLYWPLGGIVYFITLFLFHSMLISHPILLGDLKEFIFAITVLPFLQLIRFICLLLPSLCENYGFIAVGLGALITEIFLTFFGYLYAKTKRKSMKIMFVVILLVLYLVFVVIFYIIESNRLGRAA